LNPESMRFINAKEISGRSLSPYITVKVSLQEMWQTNKGETRFNKTVAAEALLQMFKGEKIMSKMAELAYELEYGDTPFDERAMVDPPESYEPKYNKEVIMDNCQIENAIRVDEFRQLGEKLCWNKRLQYFDLKWYQKAYAWIRHFLNR